MDIKHIFLAEHYNFVKTFTKEFKFFSISNFTFVIMLPVIFIFIIFIMSKKFSYFPSFFQAFVEYVYLSIYNIVKPYFEKREEYANYAVALFFYLLLLNLINLIPFFEDTTSQFFVNLTISIISISSLLFINLRENGIYFYRQFTPNVPVFIKPFIFIMEFFSFLSKIVILAFRLSVAIGIGHLLLHSIASLKIPSYMGFLIIFILSSIITLMEIFTAFLQAYIFTLFICLGAKDMLKKH